MISSHKVNGVDVAVIGAGVAGLSAALFLCRANRSVAIFDGGPVRNATTVRVHEFLGYDGLTPIEAQQRGRMEVEHYGGVVLQEAVESVSVLPDGSFELYSDSHKLHCQALVLATGLTDLPPQIPGLHETWGRGTCVCPCFSGFEVRGKKLIAFGLAERLPQLGKFLSAWSKDITVVTPAELERSALERFAALGVKVVADDVTAINRKDADVLGVTLASGKRLACDAVYVAAVMKGSSHIPASLCDVNKNGFAVVSPNGHTSRAGVFAVGNAADPIAHMAQAAASGTQAGPHINDYLIDRLLASAGVMNG